MPTEHINTLVIGGGQAGIAMSGHLDRRGVPHLVIERQRIAERWRSERWDSLVANGPSWHDRFPGMTFDGLDPDSFAGKDAIVEYFVEYARRIAAPIRCGVAVTALHRRSDGTGFSAETTAGTIEATRVVVATGPFQRPIVPSLVPDTALLQIHSAAYRNPGQLPAGAVLVVGAGSSGAQIADELARAGRRVYLSVGPHNRPPRRYRGRDFCWWLGVLGEWDARAMTPGTEHITIAVSGARGGHTVDFREMASRGVTLLGRVAGCHDGTVQLQPDLAENIARGDADYLRVLNEADAYASREGLDLPAEPEAHRIGPDPDCVAHPLLRLNLAQAGVTSIIWATGYAQDFGWLKVDTFDDHGRPAHQRGVSRVPGLYFVGLSWLSRRASPFIWGVWHDADYLAGVIAG